MLNKLGGSLINFRCTGCKYIFVCCKKIFSTGITGWGEDKAVMFGGVTDADKQNSEEADMEADIHDQMFLLDLTNGHWTELGV